MDSTVSKLRETDIEKTSLCQTSPSNGVAIMNVSRIDLNLLTAFDALMKHRNVTRPAQAVGLSQSAMSSALSRLRSLFGDELLMQLQLNVHRLGVAPRALEAYLVVREALQSIDVALGKVERFDPERAARRFRVAFSENAAFYILPNITRRIAGSAGITIDVLSTAHFAGTELVLTGQAEASVGLIPKRPPKELRIRKLFQERIVAIGRHGHPAFGGGRRKIALKDFVSFPPTSLSGPLPLLASALTMHLRTSAKSGV